MIDPIGFFEEVRGEGWRVAFKFFLIKDSEPTVSYYPEQTPVQSALRASYLAGREGIRMNIMMLDNNPRLRDICDGMAKMNGNSTVAFINDPLNLKEFVIKSFIDHKKDEKVLTIRFFLRMRLKLLYFC